MKHDTINIPRPNIWYIWAVCYYEDCLIDMAETEAEADIMVKHYESFETTMIYKRHASEGPCNYRMAYNKETF